MEENKIEDNDKLYYHIPKSLFATGYDFDDIPPHAFNPQGEGLSVNWEKYCQSAEECLLIKTEYYPNGRTKTTHGVGHFITQDVRNIEFLDVNYDPINEGDYPNLAHSQIIGIPPKKPKEPYNEMRKKLKRIFKHWDIEPEL